MNRARARCVWLFFCLIALVLGLSAGVAFGAGTLHLSCSYAAAMPDYVTWPQSACSTGAGSTNFGQIAGENQISCQIQAISAVHVAAVHVFPCTKSLTDGATTFGPGHSYFNCPDCPVEVESGSFWISISHPTSANGGCLSQTVNGVASFVCPKAQFRRCFYQGITYPCSYSPRRSPDVSELTNMVMMGWFLFALLAGFMFGWKASQRSAAQ